MTKTFTLRLFKRHYRDKFGARVVCSSGLRRAFPAIKLSKNIELTISDQPISVSDKIVGIRKEEGLFFPKWLWGKKWNDYMTHPVGQFIIDYCEVANKNYFVCVNVKNIKDKD